MVKLDGKRTGNKLRFAFRNYPWSVNKKKIYFWHFLVNTKYSSSREVKLSVFSTREKY